MIEIEDKLASSLLTMKDGETLGIKLLEGRQVIELPGGNFRSKIAAFIPYHYLTGDTNDFFRIRYLEDTFQRGRGKKRLLRYQQPKNRAPQFYLPPLLDWSKIANDTKQPIIITEGEFKSACVTKLGFPCIGLGGVRSWQVNDTPIEDWALFEWTGRHVIILFDGDARDNPQVQQAKLMLAEHLSRIGADVFSVEPPNNPLGTGIDDYLLAESKGDLKKAQKILIGLLETAGSPFAEDPIPKINEHFVLDVLGNVFNLDTGRFVPGEKVLHGQIHRAAGVPAKWPRRSVASNMMVEQAIGDHWRDHKDCNEVMGFGFRPSKEIEPLYEVEGLSYGNLFRGYPPNKKGPVTPFLDLVAFVIPDRTERRLFLDWCAHPFRSPEDRIRWGVFLFGPVQGVGKTFIANALVAAHTEVYASEIGFSDLDSPYNAWIMAKTLIVCDEGDAERKMIEHGARLKLYIANDRTRVNEKYLRGFSTDNRSNWLITSNHGQSLKLDPSDRRIFAIKVRHRESLRVADPGLEKRMDAFMRSNPGPALRYYFERLAVSKDFDLTRPPETDAKDEVIEVTRSKPETWAHTLIVSGKTLLGKPAPEVITPTMAAAIYNLEEPSIREAAPSTMARMLEMAGALPLSKVYVGKNPIRPIALRNFEHWAKASSKAVKLELQKGFGVSSLD